MNSQGIGYPHVDRPWLKYYSRDVVEDAIPDFTLYRFLWENNKDYPKDIAINYLGQKITYEKVFKKIDEAASAFRSMDVNPGEIVTLALPSIPEALYCIYALNKIGAVANFIHPMPGQSELIHLLNEVKTRVAVFFDGNFQVLGDAISETTVQHAVVISVGTSMPTGLKMLYCLKKGVLDFKSDSKYQTWDDFIKNGKGYSAEEYQKDNESAAEITHTGGTTGEPKGVVCSDKNIVAMIWQIGHILAVKRRDSQMAVLPPYVNYSLVNAMLEPITLGCTVILVPRYEPEKFWEYIEKYHPNYISSIPPYWEELIKVENKKKVSLADLRCPFYGGEAMDPHMEEAINNVILANGGPNKLAKGLGMTELVSAATLTPYNYNMISSAGIPFPRVNCMIVDPENEEVLTYDREGEICFTGPTLMLRYYNNQAATNEVVRIHKDGQRWLHTGDLGKINKDGVLFVTGRIKRIMITRGNDGVSAKLFPDRVEKVVNAHSSVELCCVIGVPDEKRIRLPKAIVVLKQGNKGTDELKQSIMDKCRTELPEYMVPAEIEFRTDLPRTDRGKIDYRALEKAAAEGD